MELRDYQEDLVEEVRGRIAAGKKRIVMVLPTGGGKTVVASSVVKAAVSKGRRVLFLAHRSELIEQASRTLARWGVDHGIIMANHWRHRPTAPTQVASVQTIVRRLTQWPSFDLVIVDECHRFRANTYQEVISAYNSAYVLGLTATPYRLDGKGLGDGDFGFQDIVSGPTISSLIKSGSLVRPRVFASRDVADVEGVRKVAGDYSKKALAERSDRPALIGSVVEHWMDLAKGRPTICYATSVEHSLHIRDRFREQGIRAEHLDANTAAGERDRLIEALRAGEIDILSNCEILTEGFDAPGVSAIILARRTASRALWKQMVGRGLRREDGKTDCIILDHAGCTAQHGFVEDEEEYSLAGLAGSKTARPPLKKCKSCGMDIPSNSAVCPYCQAPVEKGGPEMQFGLPDEEPGSLVEVTCEDFGAPRVGDSQGSRSAVFGALVTEAWLLDHKPGWAAYQFKLLYRSWPTKKMFDQAPHPIVRRRGKLEWGHEASLQEIQGD